RLGGGWRGRGVATDVRWPVSHAGSASPPVCSPGLARAPSGRRGAIVAAKPHDQGDAIMNRQLRRRSRLAGLCATGLALILVAGGATAVASSADTGPIVAV